MKKCRWTALIEPPAHQEYLVQLYEFVRIPDHPSHITEIRIFMTLNSDIFYKRTKTVDGLTTRWYETDSRFVEDVPD